MKRNEKRIVSSDSTGMGCGSTWKLPAAHIALGVLAKLSPKDGLLLNFYSFFPVRFVSICATKDVTDIAKTKLLRKIALKILKANPDSALTNY